MMDHERSAETGGEGDLRFLPQADLCSRYLGCVPADELVQRLIGGETGDRRHNSAGITRQQDYIFRVPGLLLRDSICDELQRVGRARIFCDRFILEINETCDRVKGDILENSPKLFGGRVDLRLGGFRKADDF